MSRSGTASCRLTAALLALATALLGSLLVSPQIARAQTPKKVLLYTGTMGFRHAEAITKAHRCSRARWRHRASRSTGRTATATCCRGAEFNPAIFTAANLAQYDVIFFSNASGSTTVRAGRARRDHRFRPEGRRHRRQPRRHGHGRGVGDVGLVGRGGELGRRHDDEHARRDRHHQRGDGPGRRPHAPGDEAIFPTRTGSATSSTTSSATSAARTTCSRRWTRRRTRPDRNGLGQDHPTTWCKLYDGANVQDGTATPKRYTDGRAWTTTMGHFGANYTENGGDNALVKQIVGGIRWLAGEGNKSDCSGTVWSSYSREVLVSNTNGAIAVDVAEDGKVYWSEIGSNADGSYPAYSLTGYVRVHDPKGPPNNNTIVASIPVRSDYAASEDGVLGMKPRAGLQSRRSGQARPVRLLLAARRLPHHGQRRGGRATTRSAASRVNELGTAVVAGSERVILRVPEGQDRRQPADLPGRSRQQHAGSRRRRWAGLRRRGQSRPRRRR